MVWLGVTQNGCFNVYFIGLSSNLRHLNEGHCPSWEIRLPPDQILSLIEVFGQMQVSWPGGTPKSSIWLGDVPLCYKPSSYWGTPLYRTPQIATPMRNEAPVAISWGQPDTAMYTSPTVSTCCGRCNSTSTFISGYIYIYYIYGIIWDNQYHNMGNSYMAMGQHMGLSEGLGENTNIWSLRTSFSPLKLP